MSGGMVSANMSNGLGRMATLYTAAEKLVCLRRELVWRQHIYPNRVLSGRMTKAKAEREIALIMAMIEDYEALAAKDRLL